MDKSKIYGLLRILISLSLLALLLWLARQHFAKIKQLLSSVDISLLALAFLLFLFSIALLSLRLKIALSAQRISLFIKDIFCLSLIGYFFSNFMPTTVGGDLVKGYYISKKMNTRLGSYTSIFVDRLIGMFSLALIAGFALAILGSKIEHQFVIWTIVMLLILCLLFLFSLFNKNLTKTIASRFGVVGLLKLFQLDLTAKKIYDTINIYKDYKKNVFQMLSLSLVAQFIGFLAVYLLSGSLSFYVPISRILLAMPIISVLCMLPVTVNGLGLREWSFMLFFSPLMGEAAALSLSLLYLAIFLLTGLIGAITYLIWR